MICCDEHAKHLRDASCPWCERDEAVRLRAVLRNVIRDAGKTQQELREHAWKIIRERWEVLNPNGGQPWGYAELQEDSIADAAIDAYLARVNK